MKNGRSGMHMCPLLGISTQYIVSRSTMYLVRSFIPPQTLCSLFVLPPSPTKCWRDVCVPLKIHPRALIAMLNVVLLSQCDRTMSRISFLAPAAVAGSDQVGVWGEVDVST
jgi:hypothetical protein